MASRDAYLDHLSTVPLFRACSKKELQRIARASDEIDIAAGRVLTTQGTAGREFFIVVEGTATVRRNNRKVATVGPGDYVGELALLDHGPRTATVVADTPMKLLVLGPREFTGLLDEVPSLHRKLLAGLASRVRELDTKAFG